MLAYGFRQHGIAHPLVGVSLKRAGRMVNVGIEGEDLWARTDAVTRVDLVGVASVALAFASRRYRRLTTLPSGFGELALDDERGL